jgi:hypothetical protein
MVEQMLAGRVSLVSGYRASTCQPARKVALRLTLTGASPQQVDGLPRPVNLAHGHAQFEHTIDEARLAGLRRSDHSGIEAEVHVMVNHSSRFIDLVGPGVGEVAAKQVACLVVVDLRQGGTGGALSPGRHQVDADKPVGGIYDDSPKIRTLRIRLSAIRSTADARDQFPSSNNLFRKHRDHPLRRTVPGGASLPRSNHDRWCGIRRSDAIAAHRLSAVKVD